MQEANKPVWYLPGPMFQYNEDVKMLARQAGLKIVDANVCGDRSNAAEHVPEVTIKAEHAERGISANGDHVPTVAELLAARTELRAAHDELQDRERALSEREQSLGDAKERLDAQAHANEVEAQRLRAEAVSLLAARDVAAPSVTATPTEKPAKAAKA